MKENIKMIKKNGIGELTWPDGRKYRGSWKDGKQHGEGLFYSIKGNSWKKGIWENGKRIKWLDENVELNE